MSGADRAHVGRCENITSELDAGWELFEPGVLRRLVAVLLNSQLDLRRSAHCARAANRSGRSFHDDQSEGGSRRIVLSMTF